MRDQERKRVTAEESKERAFGIWMEINFKNESFIMCECICNNVKTLLHFTSVYDTH